MHVLEMFQKILEIEVHMWKLNVLIAWVLFLIGVPRFAYIADEGH